MWPFAKTSCTPRALVDLIRNLILLQQMSTLYDTDTNNLIRPPSTTPYTTTLYDTLYGIDIKNTKISRRHRDIVFTLYEPYTNAKSKQLPKSHPVNSPRKQETAHEPPMNLIRNLIHITLYGTLYVSSCCISVLYKVDV